MNKKAPEEYNLDIKELGDAINRLDEIKEKIDELVDEAAQIIRRKVGRNDFIYRRAEAYWIPIMRKALDNDNKYGTIESTIIDMKEKLTEMKEEAKEANERDGTYKSNN